MFSFFQKTKGAVSVFLVIILVPMITVSSLFVDASRIKMSQSVVNSAGDLALNTILTQYDQDLNEYYGLLASSQDIDSFLTNVEDYFTACMVSSGVDTTDIKIYADKIKGLFTDDDDISDMLASNVEDGSFSATKVSNGSLENPALIKTGIVDFMKYRSPINASAELFNSLKKVNKQMEELPEETEIINKKNDFYQAENELMEKAFEAYKKIKEYTDLGITENEIKNTRESMEKYEGDYKKIHKKMVYDLYNTDGKKVFSGKTIKKTVNDYKNNKNEYNKFFKYTNNKKANAGNLKNCISNLVSELQKYNTNKSSFNNAVNSITYDKNVHNVQYWVKMEEVFNQGAGNIYNSYADSANSVFKNMLYLENAKNYCEDGALDVEYTVYKKDGVDFSGTDKISVIYEKLKSQVNSIKNNDFKGSGTFYTITNRLKNISENAINNGSSIEVNNTISNSAANTTIESIYNEANGFYTRFDDAFKVADSAVSSLKELKTLAQNYNTKFNDWKTTVDNSTLGEDNDIYKTDKSELESAEVKEILQQVSSDKVDELINRLNNIKALFGSMKKAIDEYKYNGTSIRKINTYSKAKQKSGIDGSKISYKKSELESYSNSSFNFTNQSSMQNVTKNNNPDLGVNKPPFWKWLQQKFYTYSPDEESKVNGAKGKYNELKKEADEQAKGEDKAQEDCSDNEISGSDGLPSKGSAASTTKVEKSGALSKVTSFVSELFKDFGGTISNAGKTIRDDLYVTDYITSMFSYDTYKNEGLYNLAKEKGKEVTASNYTTVYESLYDEWKDPLLTNTKNKSLTNKVIGTENCYSYGNEVEYILYGGTNSGNKSTAYGNIFMIRFALNIPTVFKTYWSGTQEALIVEGIANAISAATMGIVPASLVKLAICLGVCAAEAGVDISYLKKGMGVKLFKSDQSDLFIQFSKSDEMGGNPSRKSDDDERLGNTFPYFQYSDYLKLFLILNLLDESKANAVYLRTADVIQMNMRKVTGQTEYVMSNAQVYFNVTADIKVKPLMLGIPITSDSKSIGDLSSWNSYTYSASRGY